jgi:hypothetical protein
MIVSIPFSRIYQCIQLSRYNFRRFEVMNHQNYSNLLQNHFYQKKLFN